MAHTKETIDAVIREYTDNPKLKLRDIASKFSVSPSTITIWVKKAKVKKRPRGRRKLLAPTEKQLQILRLVKNNSYAEVGQCFGITKQAVGRIVKHWENLYWKPGDVLEFKGVLYTVTASDTLGGTVKSPTGHSTRLSWKTPGLKKVA